MADLSELFVPALNTPQVGCHGLLDLRFDKQTERDLGHE
jgi:hypothetical protein